MKFTIFLNKRQILLSISPQCQKHSIEERIYIKQTIIFRPCVENHNLNIQAQRNFTLKIVLNSLSDPARNISLVMEHLQMNLRRT